jgi:hypothetical protein
MYLSKEETSGKFLSVGRAKIAIFTGESLISMSCYNLMTTVFGPLHANASFERLVVFRLRL